MYNNTFTCTPIHVEVIENWYPVQPKSPSQHQSVRSAGVLHQARKTSACTWALGMSYNVWGTGPYSGSSVEHTPGHALDVWYRRFSRYTGFWLRVLVECYPALCCGDLPNLISFAGAKKRSTKYF